MAYALYLRREWDAARVSISLCQPQCTRKKHPLPGPSSVLLGATLPRYDLVVAIRTIAEEIATAQDKQASTPLGAQARNGDVD
jgi:hypothetical protein